MSAEQALRPRCVGRGSVAAALCAAAILLCVGLAHAADRWGADYFPNVALTTQDGVRVNFYDDLLKGKVVAINVIYTRCKDECPLETAKLAQVQRLLGARAGKDVFFYSITIDPRRDTPQVLKAYADKFGAGPGWLFLTGNEADIKLVTKKIGLSRGSDLANRDGHTASLMIGNVPAGQWMRNSAVDNPRFLAVKIGEVAGWRSDGDGTSYAEVGKIPAPGKAEYLFASRCSACHTLGQGAKIGPDLEGVTRRRDRAWLTRYLAEPERMRSEGDRTATARQHNFKTIRMPDLGLSADEIAALIAFLEARGESLAR